MPLLFAPYVRVMRPIMSAVAARLPASAARAIRVNPSVMYRNAIAAAMILLTGLLAVLMREVFVAAGVPRRAAFWTAALVALSPPTLLFGILFFTEIPSALLCLCAWRVIAYDDDPRPAAWALAGAATGLLFLVHARNAGLVAGLAVAATVTAWPAHRRHKLAPFGAAVVTLVAARMALNHHLWGTWITSPHARQGSWTGVAAQVQAAGVRLGGLLVDQEYGLLPYAPVFLLAPYGLYLLARTRPHVVRALLIVVFGYLLLILLPLTNVHGWTGGWSPPARFLVPIVPLLAVGVAVAIVRAPKAVLVPLLVLQIGIDAYAWQHPKTMWNNETGTAAVCGRMGPAICRWLPSFVQVK